MASKHIKNANQQILHMSPNTHGKGFPKQISSSLTTSTQLFLNVKSHLNPPPCSFTLPPPSPPNVESSGWSRPFVVDTIPRGTHTSYRSPQEKHLLFNPFANKINWNWKHMHNIHTGFIISKHLPKATGSMLSALIREGRGGSEEWRQQAGHPDLMTHLTCLFPGAQPTRTPLCPRVGLGKFLTCHVWMKPPRDLNPQREIR